MQSQEDAFASAGLIEPGMGGANMMSGGSDFSQFGPGADDYTEEELQLLKDVEQANEDRKKALYEKLQQESEGKRQRKEKAQAQLLEWKAQRDGEAAGKKATNIEEANLKQQELDAAKNGNNPWVRIVDNCEMNPNNYVGGRDVTRMR